MHGQNHFRSYIWLMQGIWNVLMSDLRLFLDQATELHELWTWEIVMNKQAMKYLTNQIYEIYRRPICTKTRRRTLKYSACIILHETLTPLRKHKALINVKSKVVPRQAEVALGVPGRLSPRIISTTGVAGRQPYTLAAFITGETTGTHFQRLSRPQGTWFFSEVSTEKNPQWHHRESIPGPSD
jgi:hypothetical protein